MDEKREEDDSVPNCGSTIARGPDMDEQITKLRKKLRQAVGIADEFDWRTARAIVRHVNEALILAEVVGAGVPVLSHWRMLPHPWFFQGKDVPDDLQILKLLASYLGGGAGVLLVFFYSWKWLGAGDWLKDVILTRSKQRAELERLKYKSENDLEERHRQQIAELSAMYDKFLTAAREECRREIAGMLEMHELNREFTSQLLESILKDRQERQQ